MRQRQVVTAAGTVTLGRGYVVCPACKDTAYPADARLGIAARLTARARKLACLFGTAWGFVEGAAHLADACGMKVSGQSLKRYCYGEAPKIDTWRQQEEATSQFAKAEGQIEFLTDGTMVNTVEEGWKEIRIGLFLKRPAARAARLHDWATRQLPATTARSVRVVMASAEDFAATWRPWAVSLGITLLALITVVADGAKWIWHQARVQFPTARGVLDIFHLLEHLAAATRKVYGEGSGAALAWKDSGLRALLGDGWLGLCAWVGRWRERAAPEQAQVVQAATEALFEYLAEHTEHLGYCERLAKGETIGSGVIEGACKYVIGRRLKRTGGRWRQANAVKMGTLCSTHYAGDWHQYWDSCLALAA